MMEFTDFEMIVVVVVIAFFFGYAIGWLFDQIF